VEEDYTQYDIFIHSMKKTKLVVLTYKRTLHHAEKFRRCGGDTKRA
jgi:hypothetical protein